MTKPKLQINAEIQMTKIFNQMMSAWNKKSLVLTSEIWE